MSRHRRACSFALSCFVVAAPAILPACSCSDGSAASGGASGTGLDGGAGSDSGIPPVLDWHDMDHAYRVRVDLRPHPDRDRVDVPVVALLEHDGYLVDRDEVGGGLDAEPLQAGAWTQPDGTVFEVGFTAEGTTPAGAMRSFLVYYDPVAASAWTWNQGFAAFEGLDEDHDGTLEGFRIGANGYALQRDINPSDGRLRQGKRDDGRTYLDLDAWRVVEGFSLEYQLESLTGTFASGNMEEGPPSQIKPDADSFSGAVAAVWNDRPSPVDHDAFVTTRVFGTWPFVQAVLSASVHDAKFTARCDHTFANRRRRCTLSPIAAWDMPWRAQPDRIILKLCKLWVGRGRVKRPCSSYPPATKWLGTAARTALCSIETALGKPCRRSDVTRREPGLLACQDPPSSSGDTSTMANHPYACSDCGHRQADLGNCSKCGEGPLLDLASSGTAELLIEQDRQRAERARSLALWISLPIGMAVGVLFAAVLPNVLALIPLPMPFALPIKVVVLMVLVTLALMQVIVRLLPPKQWWQDLEPESKSTRDMTAAMRGMPTKSTAIKVALIIGAGALVVGLGTVATTYGELTELGEQKAAQMAYAKLSTCLLGADASGVAVEERLRGIELQLEAQPQSGWPERCNEHAKSMYDAVEGAKDLASLRSILGAKIGCAKQCDLGGSRAQLGPMLAAAHQAGLQPTEAPEVEPPPTHEGSLMSADQFAAVASKSAQLLDYAWLEDDRLVALMHEPGRAMLLCDTSFASGAKNVSCVPLFDGRSPIAPSSAKLLRDGADPIVFGVTKASIKGTDDGGRNPLTGRSSALPGFGSGLSMGKAKLEKSEPKRVEVERGAFRADGSPAEVFLGEQEAMANGVFVEGKKDGHRVTRIVDGAAKGGFDIKAKDVAAGPWAEGDYVAWVARKAEGSVLMHQKVGAGGTKDGKSMEVGPVSSSSSPQFCNARGVHVAVLGYGEDSSMTFLSEGGWTAPVRAQGTDEVGKKKAAPPPPAVVAASPEASGAISGEHRYSIKGPKDNPDPHLARAAALRDAAEFGMLGLLNSGKGGDSAAWGRDDSVDSAFGSGGLGLGSATAKAPRRGVADPPKVTCGDGAASITTHSVVGSSVVVTQLRCTPEGCTRKRTRVEDVPVKSIWMVTALGDAVMMLWRSPLGALRVRTAPIEALSTKEDTIIFDGPDFGGPKTGSRQFFTDGKTALVLFVSEGVHGLWLASDGSFGAVEESAI